MVVETCSSLSCPERGGTAVSMQLGPWGLHKQRLFVRKAWPRWLERMNAEFAALLPEQHLCVCVCVQAAFCHPLWCLHAALSTAWLQRPRALWAAEPHASACPAPSVLREHLWLG